MTSELTNDAIADRLDAFATLLELAGASTFSARAYRRAAEVIRATPASVVELVRSGRIRHLRGVGPGIERRLRELLDTGEIAELRELEAGISPELIGFGRLLGLTTNRVLEIGRGLGIRSADELRAAIVEGRLTEVRGIGPATESSIQAALERGTRPRRGLMLSQARPLTRAIAEALGGVPAGDARRFCELSFDLTVVCEASDPEAALDRFERLPLIVAPILRESRRAVGVTVEGVPVTVVVAEPGKFGTELVRATGSAAYVESLEPIPDAPTEEAVFDELGLPLVPPELREYPPVPLEGELVERANLRGDLHCHTVSSDGRATVAEMAAAASRLGHEYLAICDHTAGVRVVPGLLADDVRRQGEEIEETNERVAPFRVLRGIECDIRADGTLDLEDRVLAELDWVQISLHAGQRRAGSELTKIVCEAMRNPYVSALSHPKGRILNRRPENALELDAVFEVALETGVALEINGLPDRLDLSGVHAREALAAGVELVLSSDAHSTRGLENVEFAVATARRAGAPRQRIVNTRRLERLLGRR